MSTETAYFFLKYSFAPSHEEKGINKMKKNIFAVLLLLIAFSAVTFGELIKHRDTEEVAVSSGNIKWVDFSVTKSALSDALALSLKSHETENPLAFSDILAYASAKCYGEYKNYKSSVLTPLAEGKVSLDEMSAENSLLRYYREAYGAAVGGLVGPYTSVTTLEDGSVVEEEKYGLRAFSPIASGYYYTAYDDFGASRSYGYKRSHLGHDMLGSVGTPIIAVESGTVEACGWNQYGGWRIGIRSFDGMRYYYYAHLRKDHPYNDIYEGKIVNAGEVIGYLGMTGYSAKENTNNINVPHLHFGLELIFEPEQKDGYNQIWIDVYALTQFLSGNKSSVARNEESGEYYAKTVYVYPETPD